MDIKKIDMNFLYNKSFNDNFVILFYNHRQAVANFKHIFKLIYDKYKWNDNFIS